MKPPSTKSTNVDSARSGSPAQAEPDGDTISLRDPVFAALLSWLIPGLGQWYQGRRSKALLFFICITGTFFYGLYLGEGRVVYASWRTGDHRLPYICQLGTGGFSLPAMIQSQRFRNEEVRLAAEERRALGQAHITDWLMVPPSLEFSRVKWGDGLHETTHGVKQPTELDAIHRRLHRYFELGTVFTMVAGLLNVLVIFDAFGGPAYGVEPIGKKRSDDDETPDSPENSGLESLPQPSSTAERSR